MKPTIASGGSSGPPCGRNSAAAKPSTQISAAVTCSIVWPRTMRTQRRGGTRRRLSPTVAMSGRGRVALGVDAEDVRGGLFDRAVRDVDDGPRRVLAEDLGRVR